MKTDPHTAPAMFDTVSSKSTGVEITELDPRHLEAVTGGSWQMKLMGALMVPCISSSAVGSYRSYNNLRDQGASRLDALAQTGKRLFGFGDAAPGTPDPHAGHH